MKLLQLGTVLLFAAFATAQEAQPPYAPPLHETPPPPTTGERTPGQMPPDTAAPATPAVTNAEVQQQIQKKIDELGLTGANVSVAVDDRSIVLTGTVDSQEQHDLAMKMAQSVAGDRPIDDKLQIRSKA